MWDFFYVKDVVEMMIYFVECVIGSGGFYNFGLGEVNMWLMFVCVIFVVFGCEFVIEFIDMFEIFCGKYQYYMCVDILKFCGIGYDCLMILFVEVVCDYVQGYFVIGKKFGD